MRWLPHDARLSSAAMHRRDLLLQLAAYVPTGPEDAEARDRIAAFVRHNDRCFERALEIGHITGSAWIVDPARARCLLTHHRKLGRWLQLGGHADGSADVRSVARREATEESGLRSLRTVSESIFDCDVHAIPARGAEPQHFHYDVRYLLEADPAEPLVISEESKDLVWIEIERVGVLSPDESVLRMARKTRLLKPAPL
jgi:8-oxo-dGTP pyrophosphatase MutT (NUDIX family)